MKSDGVSNVQLFYKPGDIGYVFSAVFWTPGITFIVKEKWRNESKIFDLPQSAKDGSQIKIVVIAADLLSPNKKIIKSLNMN